VSLRNTFTEDTANKIGLSQRTIQRDIQIAEKIDNQAKERIRNTELADNKKELLLLARLEKKHFNRSKSRNKCRNKAKKQNRNNLEETN